MLKAFAVLRTIFLVFIVVFTVRAMPWAVGLPTGTSQAYDVCRTSLSELRNAAWLAIAWIAFETLVGWLLATRRRKGAAAIPVPRGGEPPFAPPGHH
jgi:hypothetical protein